MIKSLDIINFGSNKKISIKLDRHITCITGESYTGKSWILRALYCASLNRPSGTGHINWDAKKSIVTVRMGKNIVKKERSKSINAYYVNGRKMQAFGRGNVPDSVSKIFNLSTPQLKIRSSFSQSYSKRMQRT
jgi:DNA repair ATPase RecN